MYTCNLKLLEKNEQLYNLIHSINYNIIILVIIHSKKKIVINNSIYILSKQKNSIYMAKLH